MTEAQKVSSSKHPSQPFKTRILGGIFIGGMIFGGLLLHSGSSIGGPPPPLRGPILFDQVRAHVEQLYLDSVDLPDLYRKAIDGAFLEIGDPYSQFLPPDRLEQLSERTSGNYAGLGLQVDLRDGNVIVIQPVNGSPSDRAGIMAGDRIIEVDGQKVHGWSPEEVQKLLRGKVGSRVTLTVEHAGSTTPQTMTLVRAIIHQSAIRRASLLDGDIGYVQLRVFSDSTSKELKRAVDSLVKRGATSLMIDVRGNPGGLLDQGVHVTGMFLDSGQIIVKTRGRVAGSDRDFVDSLPQLWAKIPMAVLVDDKTASAAEIFSGALQDHDRAAVIGLTTYGKGSAQSIYNLGDEGALKLTTARWFTPLGRTISKYEQTKGTGVNFRFPPKPTYRTNSGRVIFGGGGIVPDITVGDSVIPEENLAFLRALGRRVGQFRDALTSYAQSARSSISDLKTGFTVTPDMLEGVYKRMQARNVEVPRDIYDAAAPLISRLLSYEIERYVFGLSAEFYRKSADDKAIVEATKVLRNAKTQAEVFNKVATIVDEKERESRAQQNLDRSGNTE